MARILIAEDEAVIALDLEGLLLQAGHEVVETATSAAEVYEAVRREDPDVVLLDIGLGRDDGVAVAEQLRRSWSGAVIFVTGNADPATQRRATLAGPEAIVYKPFVSTQVREAVDRAARAVKGRRAGSLD
ncbi:MAG: response regulator [Deltaproteobacteria bacterium]|nr:response regulator [Deltaproteobacteria bacterium]